MGVQGDDPYHPWAQALVAGEILGMDSTKLNCEG
jgi:hypothetical protein